MVKYNLDFQLTQNDAHRIATNALNNYVNRLYAITLLNHPTNKIRILDDAIERALEDIFEEKFERALSVNCSANCRILLIIAAYRFFENLRKQGSVRNDLERDFGKTCSCQIEAIAEQMKQRNNPESDYFETEPNDEYGQGIEYELAEDIEHAWYEGDWKEFDQWDEDFDSVASFAVVAIRE